MNRYDFNDSFPDDIIDGESFIFLMRAVVDAICIIRKFEDGG